MRYNVTYKVKEMTSVAQKIKNRIKGKGRGWAFTPKDFLDLATRNGEKRRLEHPGFHSKFMKHGDAKSLTRSAICYQIF